jgi:integrase
VQNTLDPLRVIYRRAIRRDLVSIYPTEGLELRRPDGQRDRIASPSEAAALLAALPDGERAVWATAFYAGLRRGELRALRWSDIDLAAKVIHVQRGWDAVEGEQGGKSHAADRRVPILDVLVPEMGAHRLRTKRGTEDLVFGRTAADPFVPSTTRSRALRAWEVEKRATRCRGPGERPACADHAARGAAHLREHPDCRRRQRKGPVGDHGALYDRDDVRHLRSPDAGGLNEAAATANAYLARRGVCAAEAVGLKARASLVPVVS